MTDFSEIKTWLIDAERDYYKGIALLEKYSDNGFLVRMLSKSFDSYNENKLFEKIGEIYAAFQIEDKKKEEELPKELKSKQLSTGDLMSERRVIRSELRTLFLAEKVDEEYFRKQAYRILDITDELDKTFGDIRFFKKHGVVAEIEADEISHKNLYNLRTYLCKYQKALDKGKTLKGVVLTASKLEEYEAKVRDYQAQIELIENQLNDDKSTISVE